jgi:long-chain acyl-CoA synthetase
MNLSLLLSEAAAAHTTKPALLFGGESTTYAELDDRAATVAGALLAAGVAPGDRIAVRQPNSPGFVATLLGTLRTGAIAVPLNILLAPPEVEQRLQVAGARMLLTEEPTGERSHTVCRREPDDPAVLLFTSGTSGRPKAAVLTHGGIRAAAENAATALRLCADDVVLGAAPFSHVFGLSTGLASTLLAGAAVAIVPRFEQAQTLSLMTATETTVLLGVPTMCIGLCEAARAAERLPPLRIAHVGGAAVPVAVARNFTRIFGADVYEGYGLTELSGIATTYRVGEPLKAGSVGKPLGTTELRIDGDDGGVGEVQFRGPSVIPGYWNDPEATAEAIDADGWLSTGDLGYLDEDGYLFLVDRKKELIIRGGYNVYPREVEEALYAHPDVLEAAVIGVEHESLGEEVAAVVVLRPGATASPEELQEWAKGRVAAYKYPRRIFVADELPKGPTGKILKRAIDRDGLLAETKP